MSSSTTTTGIVNNVNTGGGATTSGAGKPTPPPDLARIIEAVNALAEQQDSAGLDSNGDLPTVTAIAPEFAAPQGQDGIAHRWWSTLSTRKYQKIVLVIVLQKSYKRNKQFIILCFLFINLLFL